MNYGLYLSASGVLTNLYRQDVFANNLANVNTVGFKRDLPSIRQREPEAIEENFGSELSDELLDKLGGGVLAGRQDISFAPGPMRATNNPLDVALTGRNAFFAVTSAGDAAAGQGEQPILFTRDGRFTRNDEGYLVLATGGQMVLDDGDRPIRVDGAAPLTIHATGDVEQSGEMIARLQITGVRDLNSLVKQGHNLFRAAGAGEARSEPDNTVIRPGHVEDSSVDPIKALMDMIGATKAVTSNGNMIRYHDLLTDRAVNVLGRVVA